LSQDDSWANHVMLGRWADIMLIAPLSCNTLSKIASGLCDNLLTAVYLSATCPVVVAPAMDEDMWHHDTTRNNLEKLTSYGNRMIPVDSGELASGLIGEGRMAEPEKIGEWLNNFFLTSQQLLGIKALVTAGPTYELIDPVRFIGNRSSGKMGLAIAEELSRRGAAVTLVLGPSTLKVPSNISLVNVISAQEMFEACTAVFKDIDVAVMSAAIADYAPVDVAESKIKKSGDSLTIAFKKTKDILKHLGSVKTQDQLLVGFALETNNEKAYAIKKLDEKNADMIVLNSLKDEGAGFGHDTNKITIFDKKGVEYLFEMKSKKEVAIDIVNTIIQFKK